MFSSVIVIQTSLKKIYSGIHKNGIVSAMSFVTIDSFWGMQSFLNIYVFYKYSL